MATYTVANGGGNIDAASTYVGGVGIPGVSDEIVFTTTSGQLTVNTTTNIQDIDFSNYTNVILFNSPLNVSRNIIFGDAGGLSTYTTAGTSGIRKNGTGNITANNKVWTASFTFLPVTYTITLMDIVRISGEIIVSGSTGNVFTLNTDNVLDPERFDVLGDFTFSGTGNVLTGTATIKFTGTANQNISWTSTGTLRTNVKVDKTGGTLFFSGNINYNTGTFTYVQGTVNAGASTLVMTAATTLDTGGMSWNNVIMAGNKTLLSDLNVLGNLTTQTTAVVFSGAFTINVKGNLAINIATSGAASFEINGIGAQSWTHGSAVYISNNLTINKASGTLTLGANTYNSGNFTYTQGDVDVTTNNNTFFVTGGTYNVEGINFNTFYFATSATGITFASDIYATTFTVGRNGTITGIYNVYCSYFNMNNLSSGQTSTTLTYSGIIYCSNDATFSGSTNTCRILGDLYVGGSCYHNAPATAQQGAANLYMVGNGELRAPSTAGTFISNLYFNTSGKITITGNIYYSLGLSRTINLIRGNIDARKATLTLNRAFTHTLTNMNKMVWGNVVLDTVSAMGLNMNEFFCGDATTQTNITTNNSTINGTVTFTDNFEKIAKFVTINGITFTRPQQLLLLTNQPKKSRNIGIRYNNDLPNGIPKGDPSVQNLQTVGQTRTLLLGDPNFIKTI